MRRGAQQLGVSPSLSLQPGFACVVCLSSGMVWLGDPVWNLRELMSVGSVMLEMLASELLALLFLRVGIPSSRLSPNLGLS